MQGKLWSIISAGMYHFNLKWVLHSKQASNQAAGTSKGWLRLKITIYLLNKIASNEKSDFHSYLTLLENSYDYSLYLKFWLYFIQPSHFFFFYQSTSSLCKDLDNVSSNVDTALNVNLSANVFVLVDFHIHFKDWTYKVNPVLTLLTVSHNLLKVLNFPTQISECDVLSCSSGFLWI